MQQTSQDIESDQQNISAFSGDQGESEIKSGVRPPNEKTEMDSPTDNETRRPSLARLPALERNKMFLLSGRKLNVANTAVHYLLFIILGLMMSVPGPTLMDLRSLIQTDAHSISFIFTARSIGYLFGSLTGGVILDHLKNGKWVSLASSGVVSAGAFFVPWCRNLTTLLITFFTAGFAMGFCNTGSNGCCLRMWGKKGAPVLQGLHFAYGLGGFLAPLIAAPFLSAQDPIAEDSSLLGVTQNTTTEMFQNTTTEMFQNTKNAALSKTATESPLLIIYSLIGAAAAIVWFGFTGLAFVSSREASGVEETDPVAVRDPGKRFTAIVILLACLQTGLTSGVEVSFTQMLTSYVVKSAHKLTKSTGSYMTSVYWGFFTMSRGLSIFLTMKIPVNYLLIIALVLSVLSAVILLTLGVWYEYALWFGTCLLGIGVAPIFPATLSWVEKYIDINNRLASVFTVISSILEMTVPMCINWYLGTQPSVLFQFLTAAMLSCCLVFGVLSIIFHRKGEKYVQEEVTEKTSV